MGAYRVTRSYRATYRSRPIAFGEGAKVEVDDDAAEWVNRDSPGTLVRTDAPTPKPEVEIEVEAGVDAPEAPAPPKPKRGRRAGA